MRPFRRREDRDWSPSPLDLDGVPELAVLAAVRAAAEIAASALIAANPELTAGRDESLPVSALLARRVIDDACRLRRAIDDYRGLAAALAAEPAEPSGDDDVPF